MPQVLLVGTQPLGFRPRRILSSAFSTPVSMGALLLARLTRRLKKRHGRLANALSNKHSFCTLSWSQLSEQKVRVDKWSFCRV